MNRYTFAKIARFVLHLHYKVKTEGMECMRDGRVHLVLPNHPAFIDPLILFSECGEVPLRPMVDERFFRKALFRKVLGMADAIVVPDLEKTRDREHGAEQAMRLTGIAVESLAAGKEIAFYPSGHVKLVDKEVIGNRRLAYEVCSQLPEGVEVVMVRTRGLEQSHWSKLKPKSCRLRRTVRMHFEVMTEEVKAWAETCNRREFNEHLEEWYNQCTI